MLYFYEAFLSVYDNDLRKKTGSYYTPPEVVRAMARLVDEVPRSGQRLALPEGLASPDVTVADPATGTGTFLLGILRRIAQTTAGDQGPGAVVEAAVSRLIGFKTCHPPYGRTTSRASRCSSSGSATAAAIAPAPSSATGDRRPPSALERIQPDRWLAEYTTELMNVLHVLGHLVALEPRQADLLSRIRDGSLMSADDLRANGAFDASGTVRRGAADGWQWNLLDDTGDQGS